MEIGTLLAELKACTKSKCLERGIEIHAVAKESGLQSYMHIANALVNMYAKCGSLAEARQVFDNIKHPSVVSWTTLIFGYAENGEGSTALDLFSRMKSQGYTANSMTYVAVLKACITLAQTQEKEECKKLGHKIHSEIGCHTNIYVQNTLIDMYAKFSSMVDARKVFDRIEKPTVVSWTALILGYAENGEGNLALELFARMKSQGCPPDRLAYVAALTACTSIALRKGETGKVEGKKLGKRIHMEVGYNPDVFVQSALIYMYSKCGSMNDARQVFDSIKSPNVVSWNALILGYAENGESVTALNLFARMKASSHAPDFRTFAAIFKACGLLGALECGSKVFAELNTKGELDGVLITSLVDFYAKCGSLVEAHNLFNCHVKNRDLNTWTALMTGYSHLGDTEAVFKLFDEMQDEGLKPDGITFLCILMCCRHAGHVEKARKLFEMMSTNYGLDPTIKHYSCMLDIFCRSNKLDDAMTLFRNMRCRPDSVAWITVLDASRKWKNFNIGRLCFTSLLRLDEGNASAYVLMAQIYESRGMWKEREIVLGMRNRLKIWKEPGVSCWTNEQGEGHIFCCFNENMSVNFRVKT